MRRLLAVLLTALVLAGNTACSAEVSEQDQIVGTWVTNGNGKFIVFNDDGTYSKGESPAEALNTNFERGTWTLEEGVLTFVTTQDSEYCGGVMGTYEVQVADTGDQVVASFIDDPCFKRRADFPSGLTRHTDTEP